MGNTFGRYGLENGVCHHAMGRVIGYEYTEGYCGAVGGREVSDESDLPGLWDQPQDGLYVGGAISPYGRVRFSGAAPPSAAFTGRTSSGIEALILSARAATPCWGGRKIRARLQQLGHEALPSASTITEILRRHGKIAASESPKHRPFQRFDRAEPNELWQMDFKGYVAYAETEAIVHRCHPLTILDDHSRYSLCRSACPNERHATVQDRLISTVRAYGLPVQMTMDNGAPWGNREEHRQTALTVWLMRLGIRVSHSRPYHPQTQGKADAGGRMNGFTGR